MNAKLGIGMGGPNTELTGRSPLRGRRSALECSVIEEEEAVLKKIKAFGDKTPCRLINNCQLFEEACCLFT